MIEQILASPGHQVQIPLENHSYFPDSFTLKTTERAAPRLMVRMEVGTKGVN